LRIERAFVVPQDHCVEEFVLRAATVEDAGIIAQHRALMWRDMGELPNELWDELVAAAEAQLRTGLANGDYVGWLAAPGAQPEHIIAGAGVTLRKSLPSPRRKNGITIGVAHGRLGLVINVFTEPEWRRRGVARLLLQRIVNWSREQQLDRLVLHASDAGRPLYEQLGFVATHEMRLADL
jgi:GNAT superfamily N-acetyltransferase